jgi:hypothetical protein
MRPKKDTPDWAPAFLKALARVPNVAAAARAAGVTRMTAYNRRHADADFAAAWDDALEESTDDLVGEAYRRAREGTLKPVYQGGVQVGEVREFSDTLAIFLLKAHRRHVYGDRLAADLTSGSIPFQTVFYIPANGRDALGDGGGGGGATGAGPPE